jgi:pimeloyl-ACP methyl ester carboxylesterase
MTYAFKKLPDLRLFKNKISNNTTSFRLQEPKLLNKETQTLVFLHGFNGSSKSWYYQFIHFDTHRVVSIDAPGFGASSVNQGGMSEFADEVAQLLEHLGIEAAIIVGHSMGGMLAQLLASRFSKYCIGLVLSCTHKGRAKSSKEPLSQEIWQRMNDRLNLSDEDFGSLRINRMLSSTPSDCVRSFLVSIAGEIRIEGIKWGGSAIQYLDTSPYLSTLTLPILILSADNDIVVKPEALAALIASLPTAQHKEMAGVGHAPYCENAEKFNQILEQFVATC